MRTLVVSLFIWTFIVPGVVAIFLIFTFLAALVPNLYLVFTSLALAFATMTMMWGPFWFEPLFGSSFGLPAGNRQRTTSLEENNHEKCLAGQVR